VLGHDDVADQLGIIFFPDRVENLEENVSRARRAEKGKTTITTEGEEVQVAESVDTFEALRHDWQAKGPTLTGRAWGTHSDEAEIRRCDSIKPCDVR
jgi:hypothetical protein